MSSFIKQTSNTDNDLEWVTEQLPVIDNGYYDTLVAIGFGALVDSYFETPKSPLIKWTPEGFKIIYVKKLRTNPDLQWLKYSLAKSWKGSLDEGMTKKALGWDKLEQIKHEGAVVDVSENTKIEIQINNRKEKIIKPDRKLYSAINGNLKKQVTWFNLCVYTCHNRGLSLLENDFEEKSITLNSLVFPQGSKGANSSNSYSIGNSSLTNKYSTSISRFTPIAVAGLVFAAIGEIPTGFAIPVPLKMRVSTLGRMAYENKRRYVNQGFFFPFDNYLNFVRLLLIYSKEFKAKMTETPKLKGAIGASYVELGTSSSASGTWQLIVPSHRYSLLSVDNLKQVLRYWKKAKQGKNNSEPSIDRKAVFNLMTGFESSDINKVVEGYLRYLTVIGSKDKFKPLNQTFFEEIMAYDKKYQELLEQFKSEEIQRFINLIRQDTIQKVYKTNGKKELPNYQLIRKLREVQNADDFVQAIIEISIDRSSNKIASAQGSNDAMQYMSFPYEGSLDKLMNLAEDNRYTPRLIAQLLLAFAMSSKTAYEKDETEIVENTP